MNDALAIAADYEIDTANLVGVNDFSMGHEAGQVFAAERIADLIRYHEAESPAVALLRRIRDGNSDTGCGAEIEELLERLSERSEQEPDWMGFSRALFHAREKPGLDGAVKRRGMPWVVFYDPNADEEAGWMRRSEDGSLLPFSPSVNDLVSTEWVGFRAWKNE